LIKNAHEIFVNKALIIGNLLIFLNNKDAT